MEIIKEGLASALLAIIVPLQRACLLRRQKKLRWNWNVTKFSTRMGALSQQR
jgi:hypothetical protein